MAAARVVGKHRTGTVGHLVVGQQAGFAAGQFPVHVGPDLIDRAHVAPDAHLVNGAGIEIWRPAGVELLADGELAGCRHRPFRCRCRNVLLTIEIDGNAVGSVHTHRHMIPIVGDQR